MDNPNLNNDSQSPSEPVKKPVVAFRPPEPSPSDKKKGFPVPVKWIVLAVVALVLFLVAKNILNSTKKKPSLSDEVKQQQQAASQAAIAVKGFKVTRVNYEDPLQVLGTVKGAQEIKLSYEIPGVVSAINYRTGEKYEEGALLISLKQDDILLRLRRAQAAWKKAESEVAIKKDELVENEKLFGMGAIPKSTVDKKRNELDATQYESEAQRLEMKAHEAMLEKSNLYAPSSGMLGKLNIEEGENISQNTLVGEHINTEYVFVEVGIVEKDLSKVSLGQKAKVFIDAYPDKNFEGVVENVAGVISGSSRTATVKIRIENPEGLLRPGMFARIRILLYSKANTLAVPAEAVQGKEGDQFVYLIDSEQSLVKKTPITVGYTRPDYVQIDAGLQENDVIAMSGFESLEDGKTIKLLDTQQAEL
ncbi:MAG TPA: efflux RND transporter periplasmic adaptor subunit [Candidatus Omnitrophota bacterium]|nr:efflux RND transporter periplasmic adaptor subunit [Candidatus Omnitrophota bacterium]